MNTTRRPVRRHIFQGEQEILSPAVNVSVMSEIDANDAVDYMMLEMSTDEPVKGTEDVESIVNISVALSTAHFELSPIRMTPGETPRHYEQRVSMTPSSSSSSSSSSLGPTPTMSSPPHTIVRKSRDFSTPLNMPPRRSSVFTPMTVFNDDDDDSDIDADSPLSGNLFSGYVSPVRMASLVGPRQPVSSVIMFDVYEDSPKPVKFVPSENMSVRRMYGSTATHAALFVMRVFNVSRLPGQRRIRKSHTTVSLLPTITEPVGRPGCMISFVGGKRARNDKENTGTATATDEMVPLVGVVTLDAALFIDTVSRTDVLQLDPVYLVPLRQHVTLLMPSQVDSFKSIDHFVVEIFVNSDLSQKIMSLAIHKRVFVYLMYRNVASIPINGVEITPQGDTVNLVLHVRRVRRSKDSKMVYVAIEGIDFFVQEGFEEIQFVEAPADARRRHTIFDISMRTPAADDEDSDTDEGFAGFMESLKVPCAVAGVAAIAPTAVKALPTVRALPSTRYK